MNGTNLPPLYPPSSALSYPTASAVIQADQSSVIHETPSVIQTPGNVSHDLTEPHRVIQNEANDQQKPCSTRPEPARDTSKPKRHQYPMATRLAARKDWVHGLGTLDQVAKKYNLTRSTLNTWYRSDKWGQSRRQWFSNELNDIKPPQPDPPTPKTPTNSKLGKIESQLEAIDLMLEKAKTPEDWQKLTNSKDKLLQNFYVLAGIAKPAARKASRTAPQRVQPIEPVEPGNP